MFSSHRLASEATSRPAGSSFPGVLAAGARLTTPLVYIAQPGQAAVAHPSAGSDRRARLDVAGDKGMPRGTRPGRQHQPDRKLRRRDPPLSLMCVLSFAAAYLLAAARTSSPPDQPTLWTSLAVRITKGRVMALPFRQAQKGRGADGQHADLCRERHYKARVSKPANHRFGTAPTGDLPEQLRALQRQPESPR